MEESVMEERVEQDTVFCEKTEQLSASSDADGFSNTTPGNAENEDAFGEKMEQLKLPSQDVQILRSSWQQLMDAVGHDREQLGDVLYVGLTGSLAVLKDQFITPRAVMSLRLFNGFRVVVEKADDPAALLNFTETLAFKHLSYEVTQVRAGLVADTFLEVITQNVIEELPQGAGAVWRQILMYVGSAFRYVKQTYGKRLSVIQTDWDNIQNTANAEDEESEVVRSFPKMCAFSNEVMGQPTEGWMEELLAVFCVLVERVGNPSHLVEECDLLSLAMVARSEEIKFERFKPVMLAALRSLLPQTWSRAHEEAWEWLWATISRNLTESTMKVRAFKPYNAKLYAAMTDEHKETFRTTVYTKFFAKCVASQDLFKQSQTRLRYIADRVMAAAYDMMQRDTSEMVDDLSALGLRHVGYGVPIDLFGPFTDTCVEVIKPIVLELPNSVTSKKDMLCPADRAHYLPECELQQHMMIEGFRWSIGLVARILMRTITEGSTAVMQAIHADNSKLLRRALRDAPRAQRVNWQLRVRVGSQSISPLYWALRSGCHGAAKTIVQDILTIRADRDRYYYGADELFRLQPDIVDNLLREAPVLAHDFLDGLIWRSHKTQDGLRPVIYYLEHLLQDQDESQMLSRSLKSFIVFRDPRTITHPILVFTLDLIWEKLVMRYFLLDRLWTLVTFVIYIVAQSVLNQKVYLENHELHLFVGIARLMVYLIGLGRLLFWHGTQIYRAFVHKDYMVMRWLRIPSYLAQWDQQLSLLLTANLFLMLAVEPVCHCFGTEEDMIELHCVAVTPAMEIAYELLSSFGVFLFSLLVLDLATVSIKMSEYKVLCARAVGQVFLCLGAVIACIFIFTFAIAAMSREVDLVGLEEFSTTGNIAQLLIQIAWGLTSMEQMKTIAQQSSLLFTAIVLYSILVYTCFYNLLVSQLCGVYMALSEDIQGHARLERGFIIMETLKGINMHRWKRFMTSMSLERRVDFGEGDIGLAGGIKVFEPALEHPISKDQIVRFGGHTDPTLPWPEKDHDDKDALEKMIQRTIQNTLKKSLGKNGDNVGTSSSHQSSMSHHSVLSDKN
eukprot:s3805_g5.t1